MQGSNASGRYNSAALWSAILGSLVITGLAILFLVPRRKKNGDPDDNGEKQPDKQRDPKESPEREDKLPSLPSAPFGWKFADYIHFGDTLNAVARLNNYGGTLKGAYYFPLGSRPSLAKISDLFSNAKMTGSLRDAVESMGLKQEESMTSPFNVSLIKRFGDLQPILRSVVSVPFPDLLLYGRGTIAPVLFWAQLWRYNPKSVNYRIIDQVIRQQIKDSNLSAPLPIRLSRRDGTKVLITEESLPNLYDIILEDALPWTSRAVGYWETGTKPLKPRVRLTDNDVLLGSPTWLKLDQVFAALGYYCMLKFGSSGVGELDSDILQAEKSLRSRLNGDYSVGLIGAHLFDSVDIPFDEKGTSSIRTTLTSNPVRIYGSPSPVNHDFNGKFYDKTKIEFLEQYSNFLARSLNEFVLKEISPEGEVDLNDHLTARQLKMIDVIFFVLGSWAIDSFLHEEKYQKNGAGQPIKVVFDLETSHISRMSDQITQYLSYDTSIDREQTLFLYNLGTRKGQKVGPELVNGLKKQLNAMITLNLDYEFIETAFSWLSFTSGLTADDHTPLKFKKEDFSDTSKEFIPLDRNLIGSLVQPRFALTQVYFSTVGNNKVTRMYAVFNRKQN